MSKLDQLDREQLERIDRESLIELILVLQQQYGAQQELVQGAVCGLLCALIGPGVRFVPGSCGRRAYSRRRPAQAWRPVRTHAQNRDRTWEHGRYQCRRHERGVQSRLYPVLQGVKDRLIPAACRRHPSSFGRSFPNANGT